MTLVFVEGFDHINESSGLRKKWWAAPDSDLIFIQSAVGRHSNFTFSQGCSLRYGTDPPYASHQLISQPFAESNPAIAGVAFALIGDEPMGPPTQPRRFFQLGSVYLNFNSDYTISAYNSETSDLIGTTEASVQQTTSIWANTIWYYLELKITASELFGIVELRIDGVEWLKVSDVNTSDSGNPSNLITQVILGPAGEIESARFDDLYVCNTEGTENNDFLGEIVVSLLIPVENGEYNEFGATNPIGANWQNVKDYYGTDFDGTYNFATGSSFRDSYVANNDAKGTPDLVFDTEVKGLAIFSIVAPYGDYVATPVDLWPFVVLGGNRYTQLPISVGPPIHYDSRDYLGYQSIMELNPDTGLEWVAIDFEGLEVGIQNEV